MRTRMIYMGHGLGKYVKSILVAMLLLTNTVFLSGCWGHNELSELALVLATAIDQNNDGHYQITVMAVVPSSGGGGSSGGAQQSQQSNVWVGSAVGDSVMDASKNLRKTATKRLSWLQNDIVIIGEGAARNGIDNIIDFIMRNRELRLSNKLLVSEGKASEIFNIPADIEKSLYTELKGMIDNSREWSKSYVPELNDFLNSYTCKYSGNVAGRVSFLTSRQKTSSSQRGSGGDKETPAEGNRRVLLSGSAVFRKDKLIDFMNDDETRGYLWIIGKAGTGSVVITEPKGTRKLTMEAQKAQSKIIPDIVDGKPTVTIQVKLKGTLVEDESRIDLINESNIKAIEKQFENSIKSEMKATVKKAQKEYKLDIFNISTDFYRHKPSVWREIEPDWEKLFPDMEVKYEVKVVLSNIGEIQNRIIGGEQE